MLYDLLYKTVLTRTDPELIHDACIKAIEVTSRIPLARDAVRQMWGRRPILPVPSANQGGPFARPVPGLLGLAAGMDKEGRAVEGMDMLGFGFVEIGTFTARAQDGNDRPRMWRHPRTRAIRNRMGFNNPGADEAARRQRALRATARGRSIVVGANIGKTKATALVDAVEDYRYSAGVVARWADYLVVNVSSPNTPGLRTLQNVDALRPILEAVREAGDAAARRHVPLLVKIAPDLADEDIDAVADLVTRMGPRPGRGRSVRRSAAAAVPGGRAPPARPIGGGSHHYRGGRHLLHHGRRAHARCGRGSAPGLLRLRLQRPGLARSHQPGPGHDTSAIMTGGHRPVSDNLIAACATTREEG